MIVLQALYLLAPLLLIAAPLSAIVIRFNLAPRLRRPIDRGAYFRGKRLFGDSKTWRGVAVAIVGCIIGVALQKHALLNWAAPLALIDYARVDVVSLGAAMGAGAMLGELPNSFVKRQLGIAPGATTRGPLAILFYVWDQIDLLTTTWPLLLFWLRPRLSVVVVSFALAIVVHPLVALIGFLVGARKSAR
jgi:CDP-2,3-bis-(O-geranylgeranyl)-sn-glycerol synthase